MLINHLLCTSDRAKHFLFNTGLVLQVRKQVRGLVWGHAAGNSQRFEAQVVDPGAYTPMHWGSLAELGQNAASLTFSAGLLPSE